MPMPDDPTALAGELERLARRGSLPLGEIAVSPEQLAQLGFEVGEDRVRVPDVERLDEHRIRAALDARARGWLRELEVRHVVGSTSDLLLERAGRESIDGVVITAELQLGGRGRRGRRWLSPFARNLAVSVGFELALAPAQMGGFSLAMGIAVVDTLERAGVHGVALKWPNDVLLDGQKLCGVLVDVIAAPRGVRVVVGVGVNLELPEAARAEIDQPATDLASARVTVSRNALAAGLVCSLVDFATGFEEFGFEPMVGTYDAHHFYQGRSCRIVQGDRSTSGIVRGVTAGGELVLDTETGTHAYGAGEVSLRG